MRLALVGLLLMLTGSSTVTMNKSLPPKADVATAGPDLKTGYRFGALPPTDNSPALFIALAFSGGGKRSAAFGYGALIGLRDMTINLDGRERWRLDEVDSMSAVSGGSFSAAYYGLYRDRIFTDFKKDFLNVDLESYIYGMYLLPWNWEWWFNPLYGTNDQMEKIYDKLMFHGATYADLIKLGRPLISINATDVNFGTVFPFVQDQFDLICSDLSRFPVARAVAASNGFPILFTPITLENHAEDCKGWVPAWVTRGEAKGLNSREHYLAAFARLYLDGKNTKYIHLMDGGIADNLAMRGTINTILAYADDPRRIRFAGLDKARRILLVSVDGQAGRDTSWPTQRTVTSIGQIFSAVSGTQIDSYNFETLILAQIQLQEMVKAVRRVRCEEGAVVDGHPCEDVEGYFVHLSLQEIADPQLRARLAGIPTGLTIPDKDVDQLIEAGADEVRNSPALATFRQSLGSN
jgi:NTE family protein